MVNNKQNSENHTLASSSHRGNSKRPAVSDSGADSPEPKRQKLKHTIPQAQTANNEKSSQKNSKRKADETSSDIKLKRKKSPMNPAEKALLKTLKSEGVLNIDGLEKAVNNAFEKNKEIQDFESLCANVVGSAVNSIFNAEKFKNAFTNDKSIIESTVNALNNDRNFVRKIVRNISEGAFENYGPSLCFSLKVFRIANRDNFVGKCLDLVEKTSFHLRDGRYCYDNQKKKCYYADGQSFSRAYINNVFFNILSKKMSEAVLGQNTSSLLNSINVGRDSQSRGQLLLQGSSKRKANETALNVKPKRRTIQKRLTAEAQALLNVLRSDDVLKISDLRSKIDGVFGAMPSEGSQDFESLCANVVEGAIKSIFDVQKFQSVLTTEKFTIDCIFSALNKDENFIGRIVKVMNKDAFDSSSLRLKALLKSSDFKTKCFELMLEPSGGGKYCYKESAYRNKHSFFRVCINDVFFNTLNQKVCEAMPKQNTSSLLNSINVDSGEPLMSQANPKCAVANGTGLNVKPQRRKVPELVILAEDTILTALKKEGVLNIGNLKQAVSNEFIRNQGSQDFESLCANVVKGVVNSIFNAEEFKRVFTNQEHIIKNIVSTLEKNEDFIRKTVKKINKDAFAPNSFKLTGLHAGSVFRSKCLQLIPEPSRDEKYYYKHTSYSRKENYFLPYINDVFFNTSREAVCQAALEKHTHSLLNNDNVGNGLLNITVDEVLDDAVVTLDFGGATDQSRTEEHFGTDNNPTQPGSSVPNKPLIIEEEKLVANGTEGTKSSGGLERSSKCASITQNNGQQVVSKPVSSQCVNLIRKMKNFTSLVKDGGAIRTAKNVEEAKELLRQFSRSSGHLKNKGCAKAIIDNFRNEVNLLDASLQKDSLNRILDKISNHIGEIDMLIAALPSENDKDRQSNNTKNPNMKPNFSANGDKRVLRVLLHRLDPSAYLEQPNISRGFHQSDHSNFRAQ